MQVKDTSQTFLVNFEPFFIQSSFMIMGPKRSIETAENATEGLNLDYSKTPINCVTIFFHLIRQTLHFLSIVDTIFLTLKI